MPDQNQNLPPEEQKGQRLPRRDKEFELLETLRRVLPAITLVLTAASVLSSVTLPKLPTLKPIVIVLLVFFGILGLAVIAHLLLHWRSLKTPEQKEEFLRTVIYGIFLFVFMVGGMFARHFWELFQAKRGFLDADPKELLMPLLVSLMVFYPLWSMVSGAPKNFFAIVAAFQNGFFWQTIFSGLRPFSGPPGS